MCFFEPWWVTAHLGGKHKHVLGTSEGGGWVVMIPFSQLGAFIKRDSGRAWRGEKNHAVRHIKSWPDEEKNKHVEAHCLWIQHRQTPESPTAGLTLYTYFQTNAIAKGAENLNKLKEPPRRWTRREKVGCGSLQCVHWEEWMNILKAMAFLAIFKAMRHYWFLRRKRILNVSRDPGFFSLSHPYTHSVSTAFRHRKMTQEWSLIYSKSPLWLRHAGLAFGTVSTHLNGPQRYASTICSLLTQCSESALSFFEGAHPESLLSART